MHFSVEIEAHVAVTTNVILEDLQVTGDCDIRYESYRMSHMSGQKFISLFSVSGMASAGALPKSRRKSWYYNPKTNQQTPIQH